ncbi:MAG: hypothetical protein ACQERM_06380 [Methanobacteriota archaeon]
MSRHPRSPSIPSSGSAERSASDGAVRWRAPLPGGIEPEGLFAIGERLVVFDSRRAYGFHAAAGERPSLLG